MPDQKQKPLTHKELLAIIKRAAREHRTLLVLRGRGISELPNEIGDLVSLQALDLSHNQLTTLPKSISKLVSLHTLDLSNNQLTSLPPSSLSRLLERQWHQVNTFERLTLKGNPLNPMLKSAYDQGLDALYAYLRSLEGAEPLYEAKLVLVGEGGVGKTT
ncbi:MAG: leucine-rich repeat domain-containing protein, partial [Chloroflexota bacterium]|nr:leucine-rich repeat domain-containing protein [Chloroflexota bacterium]